MTGLSPIGASSLASLAQTTEPQTATTTGSDPFETIRPEMQTAFAERIPQNTISQPALIDNAPTLGDRVLAGLGRISSTFSRMDTLMAKAVGSLDAPGGTTPGTTVPAADPQNGAGTTGDGSFSAIRKDDSGKLDLKATIKSVEQQGIALYDQQFSREVQFTSAEFEAHIVTVASQNMSSTLKSLLSEGG